MILGDPKSFDVNISENTEINMPNFDNKSLPDLEFFVKRMHIILLPDIENLAPVKREIRELIEAYKYSKTNKSNCMLKTKEKRRSAFHSELLELGRNYEELMKKVGFSGKMLVYFRDLRDVNRLYRMNNTGKEYLRRLNYLNQGSKIFRSNIAMSEKSFLIDNKDFIFHNMAKVHQNQKLKKIAIYVTLVIILLFFSTPNAILQSVIALMKSNKFKSLGWDFGTKNWSKFWINLTPLLTLGINLLLLILIDYSAYWQKFTTHSACQKFIFQHSFIYMLINMLIIPGLSLSTSDSIYTAFYEKDFAIMDMLSSLKGNVSNSFFPILIIQSGFAGFLVNLFFFSDLFNNRFILSLTLSRKKHINAGKSQLLTYITYLMFLK